MRRLSWSSFSRLGGALVPWLVAVFLVLVAGDEYGRGESEGLHALAVVLAFVQGAALRWRRRRPEVATAIVLAAGLGYQLLVPEIVLPIAGFFAVGALAAERPPRVSLVGLAGLLALSAANFFTTTVGDPTSRWASRSARGRSARRRARGARRSRRRRAGRRATSGRASRASCTT